MFDATWLSIEAHIMTYEWMGGQGTRTVELLALIFICHSASKDRIFIDAVSTIIICPI